MIWTLVVIVLSSSSGGKLDMLSFPSQAACQPVMESYNAAHQTFVPTNGPPWVYSYAVCEEGKQ